MSSDPQTSKSVRDDQKGAAIAKFDDNLPLQRSYVEQRIGQPGAVPALAELGVSELVLVETSPEDSRAAADWVDALARRWRAASS